MRTTIAILFSYFFSAGQIVPQDFSGQIHYKTDWHNAFISRDSCGDFSEYKILTMSDDFFVAKDSSDQGTDRSNYIRQKFMLADTLFLVVYFDPTKHIVDTCTLFSMEPNVTINGPEEYFVTADSTQIWNPVTQTWNFRQVDISIVKQSETKRTKDAIVNVHGRKIACYRFEKNTTHLRSSIPFSERRIIYFDKVSLLPVQDDTFILFKKKSRCGVPADKWFLICTTSIFRIKNWH